MSEHKQPKDTAALMARKEYWKERELPSRTRRALQRARTKAERPAGMERNLTGQAQAPRSKRRKKVVDRNANRKGVTRVIKIDEKSGRPVSKFTKIGSRLHKSALANSKRIKKGQAKGA